MLENTQSILCAFCLAAGTPRPPYRHAELCGVAFIVGPGGWEREGNFLDTKYAYVCHAELNAILNYKGNLTGSKIYVYLFPCNECAKAIIQAGIKEVIYACDKYKDTDAVKASKRMFD